MYCEICHKESEQTGTSNHDIGTVYCDGGRDVRYIAHLECGHKVAVDEYSTGIDNPPDVRYYTLTEEYCKAWDI